MKEKEKRLFIELCKFKENNFEESLVSYATSDVLGQLFFNRMQAVAFDTLKRNNLLAKVNREFRNSVKNSFEQNVEKNQSYFECVKLVSDILISNECRTAMLKGAWLCAKYPKGLRTSNDIDLLVLPKDVTKIGNLLSEAGFKQGNIRSGEFVPATREEIIISRMTRGETVPYIKEVNLPYMRFLEVDINFSLDYKNGDDNVLESMLDKTVIVKEKGITIPTLCKEDFFIHLCAHLYKEATTLAWVEMHRDMTLYKYCDIYMLLSDMSINDVQDVFKRAKDIGMEKICSFTILQTSQLFGMKNTSVIKISEEFLVDTPDFLNQVVSPKDKKVLTYKTPDIVKRFFMANRVKDLKEVKIYEKA